jgi:hypothetical protein
MMGSEKIPYRDGVTTVDLPLSAEMAEQLRRLLHKAVRTGYGQIEITVNPRGVKIVDRTEYRFDWTE